MSALSRLAMVAYIQHQGGFCLAKLRDADNPAEPVLNSKAQGDHLAGKTMIQWLTNRMLPNFKWICLCKLGLMTIGTLLLLQICLQSAI